MTKPVPAGLATLADFRPNGEGSAIIPEQSPVRAIAEAHGFIDRNPIVPRKRRKPVDEPTHSFTARVSVRAANKFIEWCEQERISYREGFDRLVALIDQAR
jgi:hypothetical protein